MGDLADAHHAHCYRLFNLWRTQQEKHYAVSGSYAPPAPDWSTLQEIAKQLAEAVPHPPGPF